MFDRLSAIEEKYEELGRLLADSEVHNDPQAMKKYAKQYAELEDIVHCFRDYRKAQQELDDAKEILNQNTDIEMVDLAKEEVQRLEELIAQLEDQLKVLLLPKDPNDEKDVIVEIRAGTGGEEAALFAGDLFRMYSRYAELKNWRVEIMSSNDTELGGFKEVIFAVEGRGAYSKLKFEGGVHRVQRIPSTESGGRIHTSAATVVVMPEAEEVDIQIAPNDLRIDVYHASGHGGQSVNTTDSAVRITHLPTGLVVTCQDEKSQLKNKDKALKILRSRLLVQKQEEQDAEMTQARRSMVGSGDRSERIRTYNFPQNRLTDHRINLTLYHLDRIMEGDLNEVIDPLLTADQAEQLGRSEL